MYSYSILAILVSSCSICMGWDGCYYVNVSMVLEYLVVCPIFVMYDEDGCCIIIFFGYHSSPMYGFKGSVMVGWVCKAQSCPFQGSGMSHGDKKDILVVR